MSNSEIKNQLEEQKRQLENRLKVVQSKVARLRDEKIEMQGRLRSASAFLRNRPSEPPKSLLTRLLGRPRRHANAAPLAPKLIVKDVLPSPPATKTPARSYDMIASLGSWCGPAFNIREYFGVKNATPFDWWVSDYDSTVKMLEENFANMLKMENLRLRDGKSPRETVICDHYGVLHHHDFRREGDDHGTWEDGYHTAAPIIDDLASQIDGVREKFNYIMNRFRGNVEGADLLFIRHETMASPDWKAYRIYEAAFKAFNPKSMDILIITTEKQPSRRLPAASGSIFVEHLGEHIEPQAFPFFQRNYEALFKRMKLAIRPGRQK